MTEQQSKAPHIAINSQYIKDLSFESPEAPQSLASLKETPKIEISLDIHVSRLGVEEDSSNFEVLLQIEAKAENAKHKLFIIELLYGGVFTLQNIPENQHKFILGVHCPALLFPF